MSKTDIDYRKFVDYVYSHFDSKISIEEVEEILHLEEDYNKDSPTSLGKTLNLNRLVFSGKKNSGDDFQFDQEFGSGINVWIADNMKGKSTIFKVVKFALSGVDKVKPDVRKWIKEILLEFQIGEVTYTIYINKSGRDKGALYSFGIKRFLELRENQKLEITEREKEFIFKSKTDLEKKMQEFFFDHFSFYTLKYTHKSSSKEDFELTTANLSWSTYFKSIYLESSNYEYLFFDSEKFGSQGRKIFEMILGLPLTYPINMLGVQKDRVSEEIGKLKLTDKTKIETKASKKKQIEKRYNEVKKSLEEINKKKEIQFNEKPLIEEYNKINQNVNESRKKSRLTNEAYQAEKEKVRPLEEEIGNLEYDKNSIEKEINRLEKQSINLELYKEAGSFFSNLDIKACPHCETIVDPDKKVIEHEKHICSLCGETSTNQKVAIDELKRKLTIIDGEKSGHIEKRKALEVNIVQQKKHLVALKKSVEKLYREFVSLPSLKAENKRLKEIEIQIGVVNRERKKQKALLDKREDLIKEEAVLEFQIEKINKEKISINSNRIKALSLKKEVLDYALRSLEQKRIQLNKDILEKLQKLILDEIHAFGLTSIEKILINDKYDLKFTQNGVPVTFDDLTEGEKLRVKLAFYLSIIQLDIEHNLGRHPRFLIFDSPGSEEMIEEHLQGLSDILRNVNLRFANKLQIFVGSALREFSEITSAEKSTIKGKEEFIF